MMGKNLFEKIVATGDDFAVFNGYCGAESGSVPVAAATASRVTTDELRAPNTVWTSANSSSHSWSASGSIGDVICSPTFS
mgnify:CR=1 FL=1